VGNGLPISLPHDPGANMVRRSYEKQINYATVEAWKNRGRKRKNRPSARQR
jgi:hypothetical protein